MNDTLLHLASLSAKIVLLGGIAWLQLYLLRQARASSRSRLCLLTIVAIVLFAAGEWAWPSWVVPGQIFTFAATATSAVATASRSSAISIVRLLWILVATVLLLRVIAGRVLLAMVRRRSTLLEHAVGMDVRMADVQTPVLTGLLRPVILLPRSADAWSGEQLRMVLTHELTHFRQGDSWINLFAQVLRAVLWFHPTVWWLVSRLSREQELTCDEAVVACGHSRHDYAAFLLDTVRDLRSAELLACAMAGSGARSLKQRFGNLMDPLPRAASRSRMAASLASFALVIISLSAIHPVWSQSQPGQRPQVYKVGGGVTAPKLLYKTQPEYTPEAKAAKIEGRVILKVTVTAEGKADDIEVVSGIDAGLDQKAIESVSQWTFQPGTKDGKPVAVKATIEINFRVQ